MTWKQALLKSIEKWDDICFNGGVDNLGDNCSLCKKASAMCRGCPIQRATGRYNCADTPWDAWASEQNQRIWTADTEELLDLAILEYLFLCDLYHEYYGGDK